MRKIGKFSRGGERMKYVIVKESYMYQGELTEVYCVKPKNIILRLFSNTLSYNYEPFFKLKKAIDCKNRKEKNVWSNRRKIQIVDLDVHSGGGD